MPLSEQTRDTVERLRILSEHGDKLQRKRARAELKALCRDDSIYREYVNTQLGTDKRIGINLDALRRRYPRHYSPQPSRRRAGRIMIAVGSLAFGATMALWIVNPELSYEQNSTAVGQQRELKLSDGSRVLLNTDSIVRFSNRIRSREITLVKGEALFSVEHNELRPFHVQAGGADIVDIGTIFSVRLQTTGIDVAVLEGRVAVTLGDHLQPINLTGNQAIRTDGVQVVPQADARNFTLWKDRRFIFDRTPLNSVVAELQRYLNVPVKLADTRAAHMKISGGFSSEDPRGLIRALPTVVPVTVRFESDGTIVIASR